MPIGVGRFLTLIFIAFAPSAAGSLLPQVLPFEAWLSVPGPLEARGVIADLTGSALLGVSFAGSNQSVGFDAHDVVFRIVETQWQSLIAANSSVGLVAFNERASERSHWATRVTTHSDPVVGTPTGAEWLAISPAGTVDLVTDASCELHTVARRQGESRGFLVVANGRSTDVRLLEARCRFLPLEVRGPLRVQLEAGDLQVELVGANGYEYQRISAGEHAAPNRTNPLLMDHVHRAVLLESYAQNSRVQLHGNGTVHLMSEEFRVLGELSIPESHGSVSWGDWRVQNQTPHLRPEGAFGLRVSPDGAMYLSGETSNGPGRAVGAAGATADIIRPVAAVSTLVGALALAAYLLYSRMTQSRALDQVHRRLIIEAVRQDPGLALSELPALLGVSRRTVRHHVSMLAHCGLLSVRTYGKHHLLFPPGSSPLEQVKIAALRPRHVRAVQEFLRSRGSSSQREIARELRISQPSVSRALAVLVQHGLVELASGRPPRRYAWRAARSSGAPEPSNGTKELPRDSWSGHGG